MIFLNKIKYSFHYIFGRQVLHWWLFMFFSLSLFSLSSKSLPLSLSLSLSLSQLKTPNLNGFVGILFKFGWELCLLLLIWLRDWPEFVWFCGYFVHVYMWIDFVLYNIHLWFFWVRLSCVLVFDFLGLYDFFGFVLLCVLDEEDVRYLIMCCWFLIIFLFC